MIDGITLKWLIPNYDDWRRSVNVSLLTSVETETGEVRTKKRNDILITTHRGKWETFDIIIKEVLNTTSGGKLFYLTIRGSLHKNHYGGKNYQPFTWDQLQEQIIHICSDLSINPTEAQISTLEIGVNISTPFTVTPFLRRNIISYKGNSFNRYKPDSSGVCLGIVCNLSQYAVKIYDKGLQNKLPENLLRFELRYLKMQSLNNRGIKYLSDLQDFAKMNNLEDLIVNAWNDVLIYDVTQDVKKLHLKPSDNDLLIKGQNPKFWEQLKEKNTGDHFKYIRGKFKNLVAKYGKNWQSTVNALIKNEWLNLFKNYPNLPTGENLILPDITIKINGKNGETPLTDIKRYCRSCGDELHPDQRPGSTFCSAKFIGEVAAHRCRNNDSNQRNNFKRKVKVIQRRGVLFDVVPFITRKEYRRV